MGRGGIKELRSVVLQLYLSKKMQESKREFDIRGLQRSQDGPVQPLLQRTVNDSKSLRLHLFVSILWIYYSKLKKMLKYRGARSGKPSIHFSENPDLLPVKSSRARLFILARNNPIYSSILLLHTTHTLSLPTVQFKDTACLRITILSSSSLVETLPSSPIKPVCRSESPEQLFVE
jgi:hypothetical protein